MFFFFNDTATTEIYTLSLHDALPISGRGALRGGGCQGAGDGPAGRASDGAAERASGLGRGGGDGDAARAAGVDGQGGRHVVDRKSTRLNSSHANISYAVFCLKKKK